MTALIPNVKAPLSDGIGPTRPEWYAFFQQLQKVTTDPAIGQAIQQILDRLDALEGSGSLFDITGIDSVRVDGLPSSGRVTVTLINDENRPAASYFYGTDADAVKGWHLRDLATLSDVDVATLAPADGDALTWDATAEKWVPGVVATAQVFNRITDDGDIRVTAGGDLRITD